MGYLNLIRWPLQQKPVLWLKVYLQSGTLVGVLHHTRAMGLNKSVAIIVQPGNWYEQHITVTHWYEEHNVHTWWIIVLCHTTLIDSSMCMILPVITHPDQLSRVIALWRKLLRLHHGWLVHLLTLLEVPYRPIKPYIVMSRKKNVPRWCAQPLVCKMHNSVTKYFCSSMHSYMLNACSWGGGAIECHGEALQKFTYSRN